MDLELLYHKTPIWIQNAIVSLSGWRIHHRRYNKTFHKLLREYEARLEWNREDMLRFRDERIQVFVAHCETNVPYYRELFRKLKISGKDIRGLNDLQQLPVLEKPTLQERYSDFLAENIPASQRITAHTSGTTGGGLEIASTAHSLSEQWAVWWRFRRWHGIDFDTWYGYFGGRSVVPLRQTQPPFWRRNRPARQIMFSAYHMSPTNIDSYIAELQKSQPSWLHGYPSLLSLLAGRILETGAALGYAPRWITTAAENLLPQQSDLIEKAFGVRPLQHYGLAEGVANISEWSDRVLRVDEDFSAVEFVPNSSGEGYKILGTNLSNPAMPLLRYDTCDFADIDSDEGDLSSAGRVVKRIDGRQEDYVVLRNGARLGRMDHIFKNMITIREAQLYQRDPGVINIRIVKREGYSEHDESALLQEFRKRVGEDTELITEYLDALPRTETGKLRFVVSDITQEKLDAIR